MPNLTKRLHTAFTILAFAFSTAQADPILVEPDPDTSTVDITVEDSLCWPSCFAWAEIAGDLGLTSAWLDIGSQWTFDFFDIGVGGFGAAEATVEATLGFSSPSSASTGIGSGGFITFFGEVSGGFLIWNQPGAIDLGDGSWLIVTFEDLLGGGLGNETTVSATVLREAGYTEVPEPGTLALLGLGLLGLGLRYRQRKT